MLTSLSINDFATIESLFIDFQSGLNVLTGETGAGKSIIIDALSLLLGKRSNYDLIRHGKKKASISGQFIVTSDFVKDYLKSYDIDVENELIIERTLYKEGRSNIRLNGVITTISVVKEISSYLVDIHSQHDSTAFLRKKTHEDLLDSYLGDKQLELLAKYKTFYRQLRKYQKELAEFQENNNDSLLEIYQFQADEIINANLSQEEEDELNREKKIAENSKKIADSLNTSIVNLSANNNVLDLLFEVKEELSKLTTFDQRYLEYAEEVSNAYFSLEDVSSSLSSLSGEDYSEANIDEIESRLYEMQRLKLKYGGSIESVFANLEDLNNKIDAITNKEDKMNELNAMISEYKERCHQLASQLSENRKVISQKLKSEIQSYFKQLFLENSELEFKFGEDNNFNATGMDIVELYVKTNLGDEFKPLSKVVSGGELSRIMLSLKTALIGKYDVSTIVFDEIDTGVSGRVSNSFGDLMKQISSGTQVLTITHLPTVAAKADTHYKVVKYDNDHNTFTDMIVLDEQKRVTELATMVSGDEVTKESIEYAKQLLS
jgi:DNA repair protein RecN (Recombination protein N)